MEASREREVVLFEFEKEFSIEKALNWMENHWTDTFSYAGIYLALIFGLQHWMKKRREFDLKLSLFWWNVILAGFSILGTIRMLPETLSLIRAKGLHDSFCNPLEDHSRAWQFWYFAFVISKAPELVDTIFIVLRKNPLIFLHWFHHLTVLIYSWYTLQQYTSTSRWFVCMNFSVHAVMYSYFALRARGIKVAKPIAISITSLQILQMCLGLVINLYALKMKLMEVECDVTLRNIYWSLAMYSCYFVLFVKFFFDSYFGRRDKIPRQKSL